MSRDTSRLTFDLPKPGQYTYADSMAFPQTDAEIAAQLLELAGAAQKRPLSPDERYGLIVEAARRLNAR